MVIKMRIKTSKFEIVNYIFLAILTMLTLYPLLYVFSMSISAPEAVMANKVVLLPIGFTLKSYNMILMNREILSYYFNSVWYAVVGTVGTLLITMLAAYPLSRKQFVLRSPFLLMITITMFFGGGMIPSFILIKNLGLYNTRWAIVLPGIVGAWNIIIARIFINDTIDESLIEAAKIDGYNDMRILFKLIIPMSTPILAYLALGTAVGFWNSYFSALIYLPDKKLHPIQLFLMRILIQNSSEAAHRGGAADTLELYKYAISIKYAAIMVTIAPILCIYPFLQKYFVKGIMIGAIK
jgi:putative aldouronate transport system permease protein